MKKFNFIIICLNLVYSTFFGQASWTQKSNFPSGILFGASSFVIGNEGYVVAGGGFTFKRDLWKYNQSNDTWIAKTPLPSGNGRRYATSFSINGKGYIFGGQDSTWVSRNDFWEYDTLTNLWTQKSPLPAGGRGTACGFSINGKGYIGLGAGSSFFNDLWEYDPSNDTWLQKASFPGTSRTPGICFVIGTEVYIGSGEDFSFTFKSDFWKYNSITDQWLQLSNFPGGLRAYSTSFIYNGDAYVTTGYNNGQTFDDLWQYEPLTDTWIQFPNILGGPRYEAFSFNVNNKVYLGTGRYNNAALADVWEYSISSVGLNELNIEKNISIFPTVFNDDATLKSNKNLHNATLILYNIYGQETKRLSNLSGNKIKIYKNELSSGLYNVRLIDDNKIIGVEKIVIID